MGVRLASIAALLALGGCFLTVVDGDDSRNATSAGGTNGSATGGTSLPTSNTSGSTSGGGIGTSTGTGGTSLTTSNTSGSTSGGGIGTTTGSGGSASNLLPAFVLDAGVGTAIGPVAIASDLDAAPAATGRLVFAQGQAGSFNVTLLPLDGWGTPVAEPLTVAVTNPAITAPPNVTVFDEGVQTGVCWEDYGLMTNIYGGTCSALNANGALVLCDTIRDDGLDAGESYSGCGSHPQLTFNPSGLGEAGFALLFYSSQDPQVWAYGDPTGISIGFGPSFQNQFATAPFEPGLDALLYPSDGGLVLNLVSFLGSGFGEYPRVVDSTFASDGQLAATSDLNSQTLSILELDSRGLRSTDWSSDGGSLSEGEFPQPDTELPIGPLAAATCPSGFAYLAMTNTGDLWVWEREFDGGVGVNGLFTLDSFESSVASMAVAPGSDGGLLLAVSSLGQVAVYFVPCE